MIPEVDPQDVVDEVLLDVREDDEWAYARTPRAVHIPMHEVPARLNELPDGRPLSVICHVGQRSAVVAAWLLEQGIDARNVRGGLVAWAQAGLPIETG